MTKTVEIYEKPTCIVLKNHFLRDIFLLRVFANKYSETIKKGIQQLHYLFTCSQKKRNEKKNTVSLTLRRINLRIRPHVSFAFHSRYSGSALQSYGHYVITIFFDSLSGCIGTQLHKSLSCLYMSGNPRIRSWLIVKF